MTAITYWLEEPRRQQDNAARRAFRVTLALSVLIHILALFQALKHIDLLPADEGADKVSDRLEVRFATPPAPAPPPRSTPSIPSVAVPQVAQPRPPVRKPQPIIAAPARNAPNPQAKAVEPPTESPSPAPSERPSQAHNETASRPPVAAADLWSYIQARRRERGEATDPMPSDQGVERNANLAANLPRPATGAATKDMNRGGGIFEIKRMTYDDAAFMFFGWNPDMGRQTPQLITVRIGNNENMRIAVVRKMIAIIRDYTQEDFMWRSARGDHGLPLSARAADNASLEAFLMHEFFDERGDPH
jgi:outer membrane biosynthesis protein TonB